MMQYYTGIVVFFLVFNCSMAYAQTEITTIKGDRLLTKDYEIVQENEYKELKYLSNKGKYKYLDYEDIFSIDPEEAPRSVVYTPEYEDSYTKDQMQSLINGRMAGKTAGSFWGAFGVSYLATTATGFVDKGDIFLAPLVPLGTTISIGLYGWFSKTPAEQKDQYYNEGYREQRAARMIKASLIGGGAGLLTAAGIYAIRTY